MKTSSFAILLGALLGSLPAFGAVTFVSASGVSSYTDIADTSGARQITLYAGYSTACGSSGTCNTCTGGSSLVPCNRNAVGPSTVIRIVGRTSNVAANRWPLLRGDTDASSAVPLYSQRSVDGSGNFYAETRWSDLCGSINCSGTEAKTFRFGLTDTSSGTTFISDEILNIRIVLSAAPTTTETYTRCEGGEGSTANDGFCNYSIFPGDEKIYIDNLFSSSGFPEAGNGVKWSKLILFYRESTPGSEASDLAAIRNNDSYGEIPFDNTVSEPEVDARITGLVNDQYYCFLMANQDAAGNITNFTNPADYTATDLCARPMDVVGLLDDKKCFIATAAWGSPLDPHVATLRSFRDRFLKTHAPGRAFVESYYSWSPRWAKWIRENEAARAVVRSALWPLVGFAWLSLKIGMTASLLLLGGILSVMLIAARRLRRPGVPA